MKKKLLSILLALLLVFNLLPLTAWADQPAEKITVTVSYQDGWFDLYPQELEVTADLAENYGYEFDEDTDNVTALDVLVAANIAYAQLMDKEFASAETTVQDTVTTSANDLLTIQNSAYGATIKKMFGRESDSCGFVINGQTPHDDVLVSYPGYDAQYTGYALNQAVVSEGDIVEFFFYQNSYYLDYYTYFQQNGEKLITLALNTDEEANLTLEGYPIAWYGCSTAETIAAHTESLADCQLLLVDPVSGEPNENFELLTDEGGQFTISFAESGTYYLTAVSADEATTIISPWLEITVTAPSSVTYPEYRNEVYDDFANDLWLQYDFHELAVNETAVIYPRRVPQIVQSDVASANEADRPSFNFHIVSGDSIVLDTNASTKEAIVTAVKPGDSIVMVSYDAKEAYGRTYPACSEVNYAYAVFSVTDENTADIAISTSIPYTSYDTLYYSEGKGVELPFTVTAEGAEEITVSCNGEELIANNNDLYTALLTNRSNIIGVTAADADGAVRSFYQVIDARKIEINVTNALDSSRPVTAGEEAQITFRGITMPVYKLSDIYNPTMYYPDWDPAWGAKGTYVHYSNDVVGELKGYCMQYDLAENNTITVTFPTGGNYEMTDGQIFTSWWGQPLGSDKDEYAPIDGNAPASENDFSLLPDISIDVAYSSDAIRVDGIDLDQTSAGLNVGETLKLNAIISPADAQNQKVRWTLTNSQTALPESYYATISADGTVTALNATPLSTELIATATTADGNYTASCTITVKGSSGGTINQDKLNISIDSYTANNQSIVELTQIICQEGDTVWSATKRLLDERGIPYQYEQKSADSIYVTSINGLAQFDYGQQSGWMYAVNGEYPNINCGQYEVAPGDVIRWRYTCNLGQDLGLTPVEEPSKPSGGGGGGAAAVNPAKPSEINPGQTTTVPSFRDVASNAWYYEPVCFVAQKGLMTGTAAELFSPDITVNRATLISVLYRLEGSPSISGANPFADVAADAWYADAVLWAKAYGIAAGIDASTFAPEQTLTREQAAVLLYNYAAYKGYATKPRFDLSGYADQASISPWAAEALSWARAEGIINGIGASTLEPQGSATRAQLAAMLMRFVDFNKIS